MAKKVKKAKSLKKTNKEKRPDPRFEDSGCPRIVYVMFFFVILILSISVYQYVQTPLPEVTQTTPPQFQQPTEEKEPVPKIEEPIDTTDFNAPMEEPEEVVEQKPQPPKEYVVELKDRKFNPDSLIIPWDTTVAFINNDDIAHTILGRTRPYDDKRSIHLTPMKPGEKSEYHFLRTGEYEVYSGTIASIKMYVTVR